MRVDDFLNEVTIGKNPEIEQLFNLALEQVFDPRYLNKIEDVVKKRIDIREKEYKDGVAAYTDSSKSITINPKEFNRADDRTKIRYLLHEFIHILQQTKSFVIIKAFKELDALTNKLNKIVKKNLIKPYNVFLTSGNNNIGRGGKYEIISYLMNDSIDWTALKPKGKEEFVQTLTEAGIFNTRHRFWKSRLPHKEQSYGQRN